MSDKFKVESNNIINPHTSELKKQKRKMHMMICPECNKDYLLCYKKDVYCVWCNLNNKGMIELVEKVEEMEKVNE